jgi:hypothetical protein
LREKKKKKIGKSFCFERKEKKKKGNINISSYAFNAK